MSRAWRVGRFVVALLLGLLLAVLVVSVGFAYFGVYRRGIAFENSVAHTAESIRRHGKEFLDDQAYAGGLPVFAKRSGTRDAGPVIGPRIHWVRAGPGALDYPALSEQAIDRGLYAKLGHGAIATRMARQGGRA